MNLIKKIFNKFLFHFGHEIVKVDKNYRQYLESIDLIFKKYRNFTMIPQTTYESNLNLLKYIENITGDVVECGVWRGGMIAGFASLLNANNRHFYLFDSFEGLPEVKEIDGEKAKRWQANKNSPFYYENCKAEIGFAKKAMELARCNDFTIVKGWFNETLPNSNFKNGIALLRLDGDWYDSTMTCLEILYDNVVENGIIIIDDYYCWEGCRKAVHDFLSKNKLPDAIRSTPEGVCYVIKGN